MLLGHDQKVIQNAKNPFIRFVQKRWPSALRGSLLASAGQWSIQDVRRAPPRLRPSAVWALGIGVFTITALLGLSLCISQLRNDLTESLEESDIALSQVLRDVGRDLQMLPMLADVGCDIATQQDLTRMAINSILVREFFLQSNQGEFVCGSFGSVAASWRIEPAVKRLRLGEVGRLQVVPSESIRSGIVVAQQVASDHAVAMIDPRQLLDRLPRLQNGQLIALRTVAGATLATTGGGVHSELISPVERQLDGWPLSLKGMVTDEQLLGALKSQLLFWFIASTLLTAFLLIGFNNYWQRQSSKAVRLQRALKKRRFAPVVQPIVCAQTGACVGAEVLMRLKHPVRGLVAPAEFIDYAERSGLIVPMSDLLMRQAHQQLADIALANPSLYFSFNITPTQLNTPNFSQTLLEIFDGSPLGPDRVLLELTERDLVDEQVRDELTRLRAKGFRIAIDDFGTGQSSLAILQDLPIDKLKIDRAFVNTISENLQNQPVLDAIIALAHRLNLDMVAEGIETLQQAKYLQEKRVQTLQGYYFAKPMTPLDFSIWLKSKVASEATGVTQTTNSVLDLNQVLQELQFARRDLEKTRWNYLRRHANCLLGSELVSWLAKRYNISRKDALRLGKRLIARGYLAHVFEEHDLEDAQLFYRFLSIAAVNESRANALQINKPTGQLLSWLQGRHGVAPGKRYFKGLVFLEAVNGAELVDALVRAGGLDRSQAYAAAVQLMRQGLLQHSFDELGFIDSKAHHYHLSK
jgi:sensor c-di-GMP phosphodiesterase-like protein